MTFHKSFDNNKDAQNYASLLRQHKAYKQVRVSTCHVKSNVLNEYGYKTFYRIYVDNANKIIKREDKETGAVDYVTLEWAIDRLCGYWIDEHIVQLLFKGQNLHTPYANYSLKQNGEQR